MRKFLLAAALILSASLSYAQEVQRVPLAINWDMDELGLDVDYNVLATQVTDSKSDYTVSAQNNVCRLNTVTIVDADSSISAGTVTITGTDCWGDALVCVVTLAASGSVTYDLEYSSGQASICAFKTITQVATGVITGEGGAADTLSVGYGAITGYQYPIYGIRKQSKGVRYIDPFATGIPAGTMKINGTAVTSYASVDGGAFSGLEQWDLVYITVDGVDYERVLVAVASPDAATLNAALPTAVAPATTAAVKFRYKKRYILRDTMDAWVPMPQNLNTAMTFFDVDRGLNTGGAISSVECGIFNLASSYNPSIQLDTATVASSATGQDVTAITAPYTHCRVGVKFGTGDDADASTAATENINLFMMIQKKN